MPHPKIIKAKKPPITPAPPPPSPASTLNYSGGVSLQVQNLAASKGGAAWQWTVFQAGQQRQQGSGTSQANATANGQAWIFANISGATGPI